MRLLHSNKGSMQKWRLCACAILSHLIASWWTNICSLLLHQLRIFSLCCSWTHQVIQHSHQGLKLQLANFPLVQTSHVDSNRCGHIMYEWFELLWVQQYQVVYAAGARDGPHLKSQSKDRGHQLTNSCKIKQVREAFQSIMALHGDRSPDHSKTQVSKMKCPSI